MTQRIWSVWVLSSSGTSKNLRPELLGFKMTTYLHERYASFCMACDNDTHFDIT